MDRQGGHPRIAQERLDHVSIPSTLGTCSRDSRGDQSETVLRVGSALGTPYQHRQTAEIGLDVPEAPAGMLADVGKMLANGRFRRVLSP